MARNYGSLTPETKPSLEDIEKGDHDALKEEQVLQEFDDQFREIINNIEKPYNASYELAPSLPVYHPSFRLAEEGCEYIASDAVRQLKASSFSDPELDQIIEDFEEKGELVYRSIQKVGLIGDSGVGESNGFTASASHY